MESIESFRDEVRAFCAQNLPSGWAGLGALPHAERDSFIDDWRRRLVDARLIAVAWPEQYGGRGLTDAHHVALHEELARYRAPAGDDNDVFGVQMLGNTLLSWGTEDQRSTYMPRAVRKDDVWCQGFSEPGTGSDLAGIRTRARLDGDEWRVDGEKIWTSYAHRADHIFALVRTDPESRRHSGLSFLLLDLRQPGITVNPIRQMHGGSNFNSVVFDDARAPRENIIGRPGDGWKVAMTLLGFERGETAVVMAIRFQDEFQRLVALAGEHGVSEDPFVRDRLAWCYSKIEIMRYLGQELLEHRMNGTDPGAAAAMFKLYWSELHQRTTELAVSILGADALVPQGERMFATDGPDAPGSPNDSQTWVELFLTARATTIYAGSSEIQRNIIAERILGMPKEPAGVRP
jgi:alkylation response protein AidB-like acyl-CoA dehydrogenase